MASLGLTFDILARDNASKAFKDVGNAAETAGKKGQSAGSMLAGGMKLAAGAIAGAGILTGLKAVIGSASDLNETVNKSNVIFGSNARAVDSWSRGAARNLGLSRAAALDAAAGFGNMFTQLGFTGDAAATMSEQVVKMSADLGSFNNLPTADVADRISAAFRGEYDSLQLLIPNISAARVEQEAMAMTGVDNADALTAQQKAAAVLAIVQKDGARAMGDFARTSGGLANQQKILTAEWEDAQAQLGSLLLGPATGLASWLVDMLPKVVDLGESVGDVLAPAFAVVGEVLSTAVTAGAGLAEFFGHLPGPLQAAAAALGAFVLLRGPVASLFSTIRSAADTAALKTLYLSESMKSATTSMAGFKAAASGVVASINPIGIALGVLAVQAAEFVQDSAEVNARMDAAREASEALHSTLVEQGGAWNSVTREATEAALVTAGLTGAMREMDVSSRDVVLALRGQRGAYDDVIASLEEYDAQQLVVSNGANPLGVGLDVLSGKARESADAFRELTGSTSGFILTAGHVDAGGFGEAMRHIAESTNATGGAAAAATPEMQSLEDQFKETESAAQGAKTQLDNFKLSLDILTGAHVSLVQAQSALEAAMDAGVAAAKDLNGVILDQTGQFNLNNESARKVADVLFGVRDAGNNLIATMIEQGATEEQVRAKDGQLRASFIATARQMGIGQAEANKLADDILGIPSQRNTTITADTGPARAAISGLINDYRGYTINLGLSANFNRFAAAAGGILPGFTPGRDVHRFMSASGMQLDLSGGEAIMRPEWTQAVGSNFVGRMNKLARTGGTAAVRSAMGFAPGGIVPADWLGGMLFRTGIDAGALATARSGMRNYASQFSGSVAPGAPAATGGNQAIVQSLAASMYGWTGAQWNALYALIMKESGFRNTAQNPTSTAYGMFQFLDSTWAGYGVGKTSDPRLQTVAGLRYIASKYGSPSSALNFHLAHNWYDQGGWLQPGYTLAYNGTGKPERVVGPNEGGGLTGMEITGRLEVGGDGFAHIVDGRIVEAFAHVTKRGRYNG